MALRHRCFLALGLLMAAALSSVEALRPALVPRRAVPTASSPSSPAADVSRRAALAGLVGLTAPSMARAVDSKDKKTLDEETARKYKAIYAAKSRMTDPKQQERCARPPTLPRVRFQRDTPARFARLPAEEQGAPPFYYAFYGTRLTNHRAAGTPPSPSYMQQVCKSGILGPSILAWALCK